MFTEMQLEYLISCNNELNSFGLKLSTDITGSQGIYPGKLPVFCSCLVKLFENLYTFYLKKIEKANNYTVQSKLQDTDTSDSESKESHLQLKLPIKFSKHYNRYPVNMKGRKLTISEGRFISKDLQLGQNPVVRTVTAKSIPGFSSRWLLMNSSNFV